MYRYDEWPIFDAPAPGGPITVVTQVEGTIPHDDPAAAVLPVLIGGYASAAAPADVSADTDAVRAWHLRSGAYVAALSAGGVLIGGDAVNGLDVDITRSVLPTGAATEATLATRASEATLATRASEATLATRAASTQLPAALVGGRLDVNIGAPATLPVSIAAAIDVSDRAGRLVGIVDTELPAAAALADGAGNPTTPMIGGVALARRTGAATIDMMRGDLESGLRVAPMPATAAPIIVTGAANAIATATLPAPGAGLFQYITHIHIARVATAALAGGALLTVTTTNLGGRAWRTGNQMSVTVAVTSPAVLMDQEFVHPLKAAVANTACTIVGPAAGAAVSWHIVVEYYIAP